MAPGLAGMSHAQVSLSVAGSWDISSLGFQMVVLLILLTVVTFVLNSTKFAPTKAFDVCIETEKIGRPKAPKHKKAGKHQKAKAQKKPSGRRSSVAPCQPATSDAALRTAVASAAPLAAGRGEGMRRSKDVDVGEGAASSSSGDEAPAAVVTIEWPEQQRRDDFATSAVDSEDASTVAVNSDGALGCVSADDDVTDIDSPWHPPATAGSGDRRPWLSLPAASAPPEFLRARVQEAWDSEEEAVEKEEGEETLRRLASCSCARADAWGCPEHRTYRPGLLLLHRDRSKAIPDAPPGLEHLAGSAARELAAFQGISLAPAPPRC